MQIERTHYPLGRGIGFGAVGGIVGGLVMYAVMSGVMQSIGMGPNCFAIIAGMITGQPYSSAITVGVALHFLTSIAIGAIFGVVISVVRVLRVTSYGKGIGLGAAAGLIAYSVLFLPIALTLMPPKMMDLMQMMSSQMPSSGSMGGSTSGTMNEKSSGGAMNSSSNMGEKSSSGMASSAGSGTQTNSTMAEKSSSTSGMMASGSAGTSGSGMINEKSGGAMNTSNSMGEKSSNMSSGAGSQMQNSSTMAEKSPLMANGQSGSMMTSADKMMMSELPKLQSMILAGSLLSHILFGIALGGVTSVLVMKTNPARIQERTK